jgi:nitrate/nitrite-specific signal transduction histidine kinase
MRERSSAVGGQLAITACSGGGTQVSAVLPTARTEEA